MKAIQMIKIKNYNLGNVDMVELFLDNLFFNFFNSLIRCLFIDNGNDTFNNT